MARFLQGEYIECIAWLDKKEKKADLIIWNIKHASQIPSHFLDNPISKVMKNGELLFTA